MKNQRIWLWSAINAIGVFIYVVAVVLVMTNGERIFGQMKNIWGPVAFLLLFVFSALVTGLLVLGRPVYLWLNNAKKEAIKMLLFTVANLFVILLLALLVNVLVR
ncbi:hypothetical protein HZB93_04770 [Candidatus Falkowbacteria bacterium]|nr:hypothetical protein [Candidatus Falkowbacteria bacterium]